MSRRVGKAGRESRTLNPVDKKKPLSHKPPRIMRLLPFLALLLALTSPLALVRADEDSDANLVGWRACDQNKRELAAQVEAVEAKYASVNSQLLVSPGWCTPACLAGAHAAYACRGRSPPPAASE